MHAPRDGVAHGGSQSSQGFPSWRQEPRCKEGWGWVAMRPCLGLGRLRLRSRATQGPGPRGVIGIRACSDPRSRLPGQNPKSIRTPTLGSTRTSTRSRCQEPSEWGPRSAGSCGDYGWSLFSVSPAFAQNEQQRETTHERTQDKQTCSYRLMHTHGCVGVGAVHGM